MNRIKSDINLSVVFLNYNRLKETRKTTLYLKEILSNHKNVEVIAVDNASTDKSQEFLKSQKDWLTVVEMQKNVGIAGLNEGFKKASGEYILVLDDDSHPYDETTIDLIINILDENADVGVVACQIEFSDGSPFRTWHIPGTDQAGESMAFVGCGFAIRRNLFESVGWFPEEFFLYQNEVEVAIRVALKGYKIWYEPKCRVVHREYPKRNWRQVYFPTRNSIWIIRRYFPYPVFLYLIASRLFIGFVRAVQFRELVWYFKAVKDAFTEKIEHDILPLKIRNQFRTFKEQNSIAHQLKNRILKKKNILF